MNKNGLIILAIATFVGVPTLAHASDVPRVVRDDIVTLDLSLEDKGAAFAQRLPQDMLADPPSDDGITGVWQTKNAEISFGLSADPEFQDDQAPDDPAVRELPTGRLGNVMDQLDIEALMVRLTTPLPF